MPTAQSNVEKYLAVIAGHDEEIPTQPASRVEWYLNEILQNGGGGGGGGSSLKVRIVPTLPVAGVSGILYLVPSEKGSGQNLYDEYVWVEDETKFELLGQTGIDVDISGYVPTSRKVGGKSLEGDVGITISGDSSIKVTDNGTARSVAYEISHEDSGVTAGSKGDAANQTPDFGETFKTLYETVDAKGHVTDLSERTVKIPDTKASASRDGLMSKEDKAKLDKVVPKGSAVKGVYIDAAGDTREMSYELKADVPENFAVGTETPLTDGAASIGVSMKYAREDHVHPVDESRASADDLTALVNYIRSMDVFRIVSGNPVTFNDAKAANIRELFVTIPPTQSGSGDPSPENVRPISGYSSVTVTRTDGAQSANAQTVDVTFTDGTDPLTVHGATIDVISGVLTVTHKLWTLKDMSWTLYQGKFHANFTERANADLGEPYDIKSNVLKFGSVITGAGGATEPYSVNPFASSVGYPKRTYVYVPGIATVEEFVEWCETNAAVIVAPLETPVSYQLTPVSLMSLSGYNSVSADAGTLAVTYRADTQITLGG